MLRDPYQQVDSGCGYAFSHAITPLDSICQFETHRYFLSPTGEYKHMVSPLDSAHHFDSAPPSAGSGRSAGNTSSSRLISPLSHEDVHSHISLSFYSQNGTFERLASLVYTEPRTYYIDNPLPDLVQDATEDLEDGLGSSGSSWSLSHINPVPSYHTPPSLAHLPSIPSLLVTPYTYVDPEWGFHRSYPLAASTERDEMHASHDCQVITPPDSPPTCTGDNHVTTPSLPPTSMVEGGGVTMRESDSVLPVINPSFPHPPSTAHAPSSLSPHPSSAKGLEYFSTGSQTSITTTESQVGGSGGDHRREFEAGSIDVRGRDSFPNIQAHIDYVLSQGTSDSDDATEQK